jgi:hypothetical protein
MVLHALTTFSCLDSDATGAPSPHKFRLRSAQMIIAALVAATDALLRVVNDTRLERWINSFLSNASFFRKSDAQRIDFESGRPSTQMIIIFNAEYQMNSFK